MGEVVFSLEESNKKEQILEESKEIIPSSLDSNKLAIKFEAEIHNLKHKVIKLKFI